ncbi:MAG TPA: TolC family outer membrane protein [Candidatus Competibacteraceae bacterium]|nr:TolC family outer membrane protein [Candidatus Competibacteraceae bacterium]MCP5134254.1 TolC family outer membrane protein [Gammaproteobacteria bacterium]HPF59247.1 TolC family outer membrane protein [Candidatus Competibacteraceae bacterium]HRY18661.1 TolC family outer membrane protein [Candidatus Competibacteraceae bacterium]
MTNMRCVIGIAMAAALCSPSVGAEDLLQIYRQSLESDPVLKAAAASQQASQEAKPQARALLLPDIGVTASQGNTFGSVNTQEGETHSYAISLVQPLYNRGNQVRQRLAEATINQADVDFLNAQNDLILRVAQSYFSVLAALDNLTFATAEKNAFARQLEQANRRFEVGLATITDVYDAQARFDGAVSSEISAANTLANTREQLRQLTGQDYAQLNILSERMPLALPKPSDPEAWVRMALENNLSLQSAGYGVEQARENIKLQKSGHYPTLDLSVSRADTDSGFTHTYSSQANLRLTIPLYSGGAVSSRSRQAAYSYEASRQSLEDLQRNTITIVRNAYRGQETAISQIKALDQTRVSTRSALEATQAGYEVGTRTIVDVLNAERDVYRAERDYAASRYSYVVNVLTLRQAAGRLTEEDVVEINGWLGVSHPTGGVTAPPGKEAAQPARDQGPIKTGSKNAAVKSAKK